MHVGPNSGCRPHLRGRTRACCTAQAASSRTKGPSHSTRFGAPPSFPSITARSIVFPPSPPCSAPLPFSTVHATQGTLTPLLGIGVCVSIQFGALEYAKRLFAAQNVRNGYGGPDGMALGGGQLFISGSLAGLANGVVSGPVEHIRIRE